MSYRRVRHRRRGDRADGHRRAGTRARQDRLRGQTVHRRLQVQDFLRRDHEFDAGAVRNGRAKPLERLAAARDAAGGRSEYGARGGGENRAARARLPRPCRSEVWSAADQADELRRRAVVVGAAWAREISLGARETAFVGFQLRAQPTDLGGKAETLPRLARQNAAMDRR